MIEGNILVDEERVCLIDFDWSGASGMMRYPAFMNHTQIQWAPGASDGEILLPDHDEYMIKLLI